MHLPSLGCLSNGRAVKACVAQGLRARGVRAWGPVMSPTTCVVLANLAQWGRQKGTRGEGVSLAVVRGAWTEALNLRWLPVL